MKKSHQLLAGTLLVSMLAGTLLLVSVPPGPAVTPVNATLLPEPRTVGAFSLIDEGGNSFDQNDLRDRWTLLFFGFTHCPDICPVTLQQLVAARNVLTRQGTAPIPEILFISVDPDRDSPAVVADYVANFGGSVRGASGELPALQQLAGQLGIYFSREPAADEGYQVNHSAAVLLINPRGELHAIFSAPHSVEALVHDLPIVLAAL